MSVWVENTENCHLWYNIPHPMPLVDNPRELIDWYEGQTRVLTPDFLSTIPWHEIKDHELKEEFIPVLTYMRDVEKFTELYYKELLMTPTGREPILRRFIDRWSVEEQTHGDLLNRFLEEANIPVTQTWFEDAKAGVSPGYKLTSTVTSLLTNAFGKHFSAVHMTWGAINELTTLHGYRSLWEKAKHPVLEYLLRAIAREEAVHAFFYSTLARFQLQQSKFSRQLTRYIITHFWSPVGQGAKPEVATNYLIKTLFQGTEGVQRIETFVNNPIAQLPGLDGLKTVTNTIERTALAS